MSVIQALIFDLDGVLADTLPLHFRAWQHLATQHNIPLEDDAFEQFRGRHSRDSLAALFAEQVLSDDQIEHYLRIKNEHYLAQIEAIELNALLADGAYDLIHTAKATGLKVGVASSSTNTHKLIEKVGLQSQFDVIADGFTVQQPKPAPDIFLWVADALGVEPSSCIVFEDSSVGVEAAHTAGMVVIGISPVADPLPHTHLTLASLKDFDLNVFRQDKVITGSDDARN
jgi:beta-phosphoglucomutase